LHHEGKGYGPLSNHMPYQIAFIVLHFIA